MFRKRHDTESDERVEHVRTDADEPAPGRRADRARGLARGVATLIGAGAAGFLVWLATQFADDSTGDYWAAMALVAAAGLALALSQLLGGWTKWGWPRLSRGVFLLGFLPALVVGGWLLLAHQPSDEWFRGDVLDWSGDLGVGGLVDDFERYVPVVAFGLGLLFGFTFDTTGPRVVEDRAVVERDRAEARPVPVEERAAADEPLTAERETVAETPPARDVEDTGGRRWFGRRRATETDGDTAVAERPPPE